MTIKERIREVITVEPLIVAYLIGSAICGPQYYLRLGLRKSCDLKLNTYYTKCSFFVDRGESVTETRYVAPAVIDPPWRSPFQIIISLIVTFIVASSSDRHKLRKPLFLMPLLGAFLAVAGNMLCVFFMRKWPLTLQMITESVLPSLFGGKIMMMMAASTYITEVSTVKWRTFRLEVIAVIAIVGRIFGDLVFDVLVDSLTHFEILSVAAGCYFFALLYAIFWIREPRQPDDISTKSFIIDAFDSKHFTNTRNLLLTKSLNNNRVSLFVVLIILFMCSVFDAGEDGVFYSDIKTLFTEKKVEWSILRGLTLTAVYQGGVFKDDEDRFVLRSPGYLLFRTVNANLHQVGTFIGIFLSMKCLQMNDLKIIVVSFADKILSNVIYGFAQSTMVLYIGSVVGMFSSIFKVVSRSLVTKMASPDDTAKAQSLVEICEAIGSAVGPPVYNEMYRLTSDAIRTTYLFFGVALSATCLVAIRRLYFVDKSTNNQAQEQHSGTVNGGFFEDAQMTHPDYRRLSENQLTEPPIIRNAELNTQTPDFVIAHI